MKKLCAALLLSAGVSVACEASEPKTGLWHHHIETRIHIHASPAQIWAVLMDFERYPEWNPFIRHLEWDAVAAHKLRVRVRPVGGREMTFEPEVLQIEPAEAFRWRGRLFMPGLFDGEHDFLLRPHPEGGTWLIHSEHFTGLLVPFLREQLDTGTRPGFEAMNAALRQQVLKAASAK